MNSGTILVTGSAGFVGRATLSSLERATCCSRLRLLVHKSIPPLSADGRVEHAVGDLADPTSLRSVCDGIDTVLHLASHVSDDPGSCETVNARGTEALVASASTAGVKRLIYLSTAAVYGYAVHRGANEDEVSVAPATPVSRSRVLAERAVLAAGGIVLRPLFVYGDGDTRFIPVVLGALTRLPVLVDRGDARVSVLAVDDLAAVLVALTEIPPNEWVPGAYHITDGHPIAFRNLAASLGRTLGFDPPRRSLPYPVARLMLRAVGSRAFGSKRWSASAAHRLFLVARDHFYDSSRLWGLVGLRPGAPFANRIQDYTGWYGQFLPGAKAGVGS